MKYRWVAAICSILMLTACDGCQEEEPAAEDTGDAGDIVDMGPGDAEDTGPDDIVADVPEDTGDGAVADGDGDVVDDVDAADADDADAGPTPATLSIVYGDQTPSGIRVLAHNESGDVMADMTTNDEGVVTAEVGSDWMFTVLDVLPNREAKRLTITDIQPGDEVSLELPAVAQSEGMVEVSLPGTLSGTDQYRVGTGCGRSSPATPGSPQTLFIIRPCDKDNVDVLAVALDADGNVLGHAIERNIQTQSGQTTQVNLTSWNQNPINAELSLSDIPQDYSFESQPFLTKGQRAWQFRKRDEFAPVTSVTKSWGLPPEFGHLSLVYGLEFERQTDPTVITREALTFSDTTSDISTSASVSDLLPMVDATINDPRGDRPTSDWTTEPLVTGGATVADADTVFVRMSTAGGSPLLELGGSDSVDREPQGAPGPGLSWVIIAPQSQSTIQFPAVPSDVDLPDPGVDVDFTTGIFDTPSLDGYNAYKSNPTLSNLMLPGQRNFVGRTSTRTITASGL